ncbi:UNVERIFIED_CONTAM: hypothetical protein GTU68_057044 [Idotea baltica]|nr:hypothetical protein [Idotea baltica]
MVGYMNKKAYKKTKKERLVTFYSRSRAELWTKGETSGNYLEVVKILKDCDRDTLLIKVNPTGPVCHTGADTCFSEKNRNTSKLGFLYQLEEIIRERKENPIESSHTSRLFQRGINKIAQKVGEEAVEVVIEAKDDDMDLFQNECADLLFHMMILLEAKDTSLPEIVEILSHRNKVKR